MEGEAFEVAYLTLLALFILEEAFDDYEDEWELIARKAKEYLTKVSGIDKPLTIARKFSLTVKLQ